MTNNTYWGNVPEQVTILAPGEYSANDGIENEWHAIPLGDVVVQGSLEDWKLFAANLTEQLAATEANPPVGNQTQIPMELEAWIAEDQDSSDYSLYVLDGQTKEHSEVHGPENDGGSCYHDVVAIVDGSDGESATKYTMNPDGQISARAI